MNKSEQNVPNDDLISRKAAIDALSESMPKMSTPDGRGDFDHEIHIACETTADDIEIIKRLPSAQLEIIACNQCVHYQQNHHYCEFLDTEFSPSDFCSMAERREE